MPKAKEEVRQKDDTSVIKTLVNMIATICEEPMLQADQIGIQFRAMDSTHVTLLDIEIPKTTFNSFDFLHIVFPNAIRTFPFLYVLRE